MNYRKIYDQLINRAKNRTLTEYKERHHIVPKSLGGSDDPDNLAELTAREHFIAHWLLMNIQDPDKDNLAFAKMSHAFFMMTVGSKRNITGRRYEIAKRAVQKVKKNKLVVLEKSSNVYIVVHKNAYHKNKELYGRANSFGDIKVKCPFCNEETDVGNFAQYHGVNCLHLDNPNRENAREIRKSISKKRKRTCKYCGKKVAANMLNRYHNDNCIHVSNPLKEQALANRAADPSQQLQECIYCGKNERLTNLKRFHNENCRDPRNPNASTSKANLPNNHPNRIRVSCLQCKREVSLQAFYVHHAGDTCPNYHIIKDQLVVSKITPIDDTSLFEW